MNKYSKLVLRTFFYLLGLLIMAFAAALSINTNLGIAPNSSLPYALSMVLNTKMSTCIISISILHLVLQAIVLRQGLKWQMIAQFVVSTIFGYFIDFANWVVGDFCFPTYFGQMALLLISILLIGLGVSMYVDASFIPSTAEGLSLAVSKAFGIKFHNAKNIQDIVTVVLALLLGLVFLKNVVGVREGTILSALLVGRAVKLMQKWIKPMIDKLCF